MAGEGDEIDKSRAPLIEHLMELRTRLIWSLVAFFIAFIGCFAFAKHLFNYLVYPYKWAVIWAHLDVSKSELIYTAPQEFFFTQIKLDPRLREIAILRTATAYCGEFSACGSVNRISP